MADDRPKVFNVAGGRIVPDFSELDFGAALVQKHDIEVALAATRNDPSRAAERERLKAENEAIHRRLTEIKEERKQENLRKNFAGVGSPLWEALVARFDVMTVAELEAAAMALLAERERMNAERKAKKGK